MGYTLYRRSSGSPWYAQFVDREGRRIRATTKQSDKRRAHVVAAEIYRRYADPLYKASHETTLQDGGRALMLVLREEGRSEGTMNMYRTKLSHVERVLGTDLPLARVTAQRVDHYIATRRAEGAKANTIHKELTAIRRLLKHARRRGEFDKEVSQVMPVKFSSGYTPRTRALTEEQVPTLLTHLPLPSQRYVLFVLCTTARDAATRRARFRDVDIFTGMIHVYDFKTKGSRRAVPVTPISEPYACRLFSMLEGLGPDDLIVGGGLNVRNDLKKACVTMKIEPISPNDLRRSMATWMRAAGVPPNIIGQVMGHTDSRMVERIYGRVDATALKAMLDRLLDVRRR